MRAALIVVSFLLITAACALKAEDAPDAATLRQRRQEYLKHFDAGDVTIETRFALKKSPKEIRTDDIRFIWSDERWRLIEGGSDIRFDGKKLTKVAAPVKGATPTIFISPPTEQLHGRLTSWFLIGRFLPAVKSSLDDLLNDPHVGIEAAREGEMASIIVRCKARQPRGLWMWTTVTLDAGAGHALRRARSVYTLEDIAEKDHDRVKTAFFETRFNDHQEVKSSIGSVRFPMSGETEGVLTLMTWRVTKITLDRPSESSLFPELPATAIVQDTTGDTPRIYKRGESE